MGLPLVYPHVSVPWSCKVATLGVMLSAMVVVLAGELSLAMASFLVWGFARARFDLLYLMCGSSRGCNAW